MTTGAVGDGLLRVLSPLLGDEVEYASQLRPLGGGLFSEMFTFELRHAPREWSGRLILRLLPWTDMQVRIEGGIQKGARLAGLPAPRVVLLEPSPAPLGTPFMVMEHLTGRPFLGGITWYRFARDFPKMVRSWPEMFATTLSVLEQADPSIVVDELARRGVPSDAADTTRHLRWVRETVPVDSPFEDAISWLHANRPSAPDRVHVVHGDLWPTNVFTREGAVTGLVDWTTGAVGDPALDVGFAKVGLALMPEPVPPPAPIRNVIRAAGIRMARQIDERCGEIVGDERSRYYEALRCMVQIAVRYDEHRRVGRSRWDHGLPALIGHLNSRTGLRLRPD